MSHELEDESYVIQIRAKLNQQKVKLWEIPYYNSTNEECAESELEVILENIQMITYTFSKYLPTILFLETGHWIPWAATNFSKGLFKRNQKAATECIG